MGCGNGEGHSRLREQEEHKGWTVHHSLWPNVCVHEHVCVCKCTRTSRMGVGINVGNKPGRLVGSVMDIILQDSVSLNADHLHFNQLGCLFKTHIPASSQMD